MYVEYNPTSTALSLLQLTVGVDDSSFVTASLDHYHHPQTYPTPSITPDCENGASENVIESRVEEDRRRDPVDPCRVDTVTRPGNPSNGNTTSSQNHQSLHTLIRQKK